MVLSGPNGWDGRGNIVASQTDFFPVSRSDHVTREGADFSTSVFAGNSFETSLRNFYGSLVPWTRLENISFEKPLGCALKLFRQFFEYQSMMLHIFKKPFVIILPRPLLNRKYQTGLSSVDPTPSFSSNPACYDRSELRVETCLLYSQVYRHPTARLREDINNPSLRQSLPSAGNSLICTCKFGLPNDGFSD